MKVATYSAFINEQGRLADEALREASTWLGEADRHHRAVLAGRVLEMTNEIKGLSWENISGQPFNLAVCLSDYSWLQTTSERFADELGDPREVRELVDLLTQMPEFRLISMRAGNEKVLFEFEDVTGGAEPAPDSVDGEALTEAQSALSAVLTEKLADNGIISFAFEFRQDELRYDFTLRVESEPWRGISPGEFKQHTGMSFEEFTIWVTSLDEFIHVRQLCPQGCETLLESNEGQG